jgi:hypothetical protein
MMNEQTQILETSPEFSDEQLIAICEAADVIACECPSYLVQLLKEVKEFRRYTTECGERFPDSADSHHWLSNRAAQFEKFLSQTIHEFFQKEHLMDENNQIDLQRLSERNRMVALERVV